MGNILEVKNLSKSYLGKCALNNVNFTLKEGEILGLLGVNGSGKTTLIKILSGIIGSYEGSIVCMGKPLGVESKKYIAYLPDVAFISHNWFVGKSVDFFDDFFDDFDKVKAKNILRDLDISLESRFSSLSKGTQEKLQLTLILSRKAKLYIFDEPIAGVDVVARDMIFDLIVKNYTQDSSIIISTHLVSSIDRILTSALFIKYGEIVIQDSIESLKARFEDKNLEEIFKEIF